MWRYQLFRDKAGKWRWRLLSSSGRKVAVSGESFASRANARRAALNVARNAGRAVVPSETDLGRLLRATPARSPNKAVTRLRKAKPAPAPSGGL